MSTAYRHTGGSAVHGSFSARPPDGDAWRVAACTQLFDDGTIPHAEILRRAYSVEVDGRFCAKCQRVMSFSDSVQAKTTRGRNTYVPSGGAS